MRQLCKIRLPVPKDYVGVGHQHHSVYGRRFLWPILGIYLDIAWRDSRKITKTLRYPVYRPIFKSGTVCFHLDASVLAETGHKGGHMFMFTSRV